MLLVDDDPLILEVYEAIFRAQGCHVRAAASSEQALCLAQVEPPDLAVLDLRLPGRDGLWLAAELRKLDRPVLIAMVTAHEEGISFRQALRLHLTACIPKDSPTLIEELLALLARAPMEGPPFPLSEQPFTLWEMEREYVRWALAFCEGNRARTAHLLGIDRRTLQRKLEKLGIDRTRLD